MSTAAASRKKASFSWFKFAYRTCLAVHGCVVLGVLKRPVPRAPLSHIAPEQPVPGPTPATPAPAPPSAQPQGPPQVKSMQFAMVGNEVVGQFVVERYGMDIYVTLSGQLTSKDGYVSLKPSLFKVGDPTVPIDWVD